ncbi:hypothetical protein D3C76_1554960 [compost metagenome]
MDYRFHIGYVTIQGFLTNGETVLVHGFISKLVDLSYAGNGNFVKQVLDALA